MKLIIGSLKIQVNDNYIRCVEEGKHTLEKGYDAKVAVLREAIEQTFNEKLLRTTKSSDDKINNMKLIIGRFKIHVQRQLNNLINANTELENNITQTLSDHLPTLQDLSKLRIMMQQYENMPLPPVNAITTVRTEEISPQKPVEEGRREVREYIII